MEARKRSTRCQISRNYAKNLENRIQNDFQQNHSENTLPLGRSINDLVINLKRLFCGNAVHYRNIQTLIEGKFS